MSSTNTGAIPKLCCSCFHGNCLEPQSTALREKSPFLRRPLIHTYTRSCYTNTNLGYAASPRKFASISIGTRTSLTLPTSPLVSPPESDLNLSIYACSQKTRQGSYQLQAADDHQCAPPVAPAHAFALKARFGPREASGESGVPGEVQLASRSRLKPSRSPPGVVHASVTAADHPGPPPPNCPDGFA